VKKIRLLTNNPKKIVGLEAYGMEVVDRLPIEVEPNENNRDYLFAKKTKLGHILKWPAEKGERGEEGENHGAHGGR